MSGLKIIELDGDNIELAVFDETPSTTPTPKENVIQDADEKWEKLVLYYLARLKGLCDWRNSSHQTIPAKHVHAKKCASHELETRIIDNVKQKPLTVAGNKKQKDNAEMNDVGYYITAGYDEGKQQAVKIISRSLKYGVMTGILTKHGNCYRIAPQYLFYSKPLEAEKIANATKNKKDRVVAKRNSSQKKCSIQSVKRNIRNKRANDRTKKALRKKTFREKRIQKKKSSEAKTSIPKQGRKRKLPLQNVSESRKQIKVKSETSFNNKEKHRGVKRNYGGSGSSVPPTITKKSKRSSDTNVNLNESSSNSNTSFQSLSRSLTPIDERDKKREVKAKRPRPKIQKPINYVPPLKKPRTKSQSKSPSHHTDEDEVKDIINQNSRDLINIFRMPRPRRYSDVMSSMSSTSLNSLCSNCRYKEQKTKKRRRK